MKNDRTGEMASANRPFWATRGMVVFASFIVMTSGMPAAAQTPTRPEFEAVSIKQTLPGARGGGGRVLPSGRLEAKNVNLKYLMTVAYSVTNYQIVGNQDLLESQTYDVIAAAGHPVDTPQLRLMLQSALEDILKLKVHRETRELPIYSLVLSKPGVKGALAWSKI
jgi:uncharacterized protein (TIGR03435 family)